MVVLLSYSCSCIFSFLYQFISIEETSFDYLHRRSKCDYCNSSLKWYELMPIISFIIKRAMSKLSKAYFPNTFLRETFALIPIVFIKYDFTNVNATLFITTYVFCLFYYDRYHFFNVRLSLNYNLLYRFSLVKYDLSSSFYHY